MKRIEMKGKEFMEKILKGERNFSRIKLEENFKLSVYNPEGFYEMQIYLIAQNLKDNPINIQYSEFPGFCAERLHLPYTKGKEANFKKANLWRANFEGANLEGTHFDEADLKGATLDRSNLMGANFFMSDLRVASLKKANLCRAYLWRAKCGGADFSEADFEGANLGWANLEGACLEKANLEKTVFLRTDLINADLRFARNLNHTQNLETANFLETVVNEDEKGIIEETLKKRKLFVPEYNSIF